MLSMKVSELKKLLRKHGCYQYREGSNHEMWEAPNGNVFPVPRHNTQDVPIGTLKSIKKMAGIE